MKTTERNSSWETQGAGDGVAAQRPQPQLPALSPSLCLHSCPSFPSPAWKILPTLTSLRGSFAQVTGFNVEKIPRCFPCLAPNHSFRLSLSNLLQVSEHLCLNEVCLSRAEPGSSGRDALMKLCTSVHNKIGEQKACEVLGRERERRERETAGLGLEEKMSQNLSSQSPQHLGHVLLRAGPAGVQGCPLHQVQSKT